jgi:4-amino-4-deoxy-L-arabinose transferase-like glycosyltransferase
MPSLHSSSRQSAGLGLIAVVGLFCVPLFVGLDRWDLANDESIYSYSVDRILETGEWLTPRLIPEDGPFLEKPPLKFWMVAGLIQSGLLPQNALGMRALDAVFGALAFVYVFALGRRLSGPLCGVIAVLVLFTFDLLLVDHGLRSNNMEAALVLAYCGGIYHFARWEDADAAGRRLPHALAVAGFFVLGFMTKFVAALFLPVVAAAAFAVQPGALSRLRAGWRDWGLAALLVLAATAPWFVYEAVHEGDALWQTMFGVHVYTRFTSSLNPEHLHPWHYYYSMTWLVFSRAGSQWLALVGLATLAATALTGRPWLARLLFIWWLLPFALISLGSSKLIHYAYPFLPPIALGAGVAVAFAYRVVAAAFMNRRVAGALSRTLALAIVAIALPLLAYSRTLDLMTTTRRPLSALRSCAAGIEKPVPEVHVYPTWAELGVHTHYYYLRGIAPVNVHGGTPKQDEWEKRLFTPGQQTLVVLTRPDYDAIAAAVARGDSQAGRMPIGLTLTGGNVLLAPGPYEPCALKALESGGTPVD